MSAVPAKRPCGSCPYRRDVPSGVWSEDEYAKLPPYDAETAFQPPSAFFCHQQDGRLCAGWVACHDMDESLGLRFATIAGAVPGEDVDAILDYTTDVPVFDSGAEAAEHGLRDLLAPPPETRKVIDRLERKLDAMTSVQIEQRFTDEVLSPSRTTRSFTDHVTGWAEVIQGDELLVDVSAYTDEFKDEPLQWCVAGWPAPGSAAVYPYRVRIPFRGNGQYKASQVLGWRRPIDLHRNLMEAAKQAGRRHAGVSVEPWSGYPDSCEEWLPKVPGRMPRMCGAKATWLVNGRTLCTKHMRAVDAPSILELTVASEDARADA